MDVRCVDSTFTFTLSPSDAVGLFAVLTANTDNPAPSTPEQFQKGQMMWSWFFGQVQAIASRTSPTTGAPPEEKTKRPRKSKA